MKTLPCMRDGLQCCLDMVRGYRVNICVCIYTPAVRACVYELAQVTGEIDACEQLICI